MPSLLAIVETVPGWTTTPDVVGLPGTALGRRRLHRANGGEFDARLDAVAAELLAPMPPSRPKPPLRSAC